MTAINNTAAAIVSGKGKTARVAAFSRIAEQAYGAENGKALFLATLEKALGNAPTKEQIKLARDEVTIGIAAMRMPANELARGAKATDMASRLTLVRDLFDNYAAPSTAVAGKVPALRKGKTGWRSAGQHRIIRNAEDRASKYLAELGAGNAKTEADKNAAKGSRVAKGKPVTRATGTVGKTAAPEHSQLVTPAKPETPQSFAAQMLNMISTAMHYANKHAKAQPLEFNPVTEAVIALHKLALKADAELHVRIAAQDAEAKRKRA